MAEAAAAGAVEKVRKGILSNAGISLPESPALQPEKK
jgi:hypothetical protein